MFIPSFFFLLATAHPSTPQPAPRESHRHTDWPLTVDENREGGRVLLLSDGTMWEIAPEDRRITGVWIFPSPLSIERSLDTFYSHYIVNLVSHTKVSARPITASELEEIGEEEKSLAPRVPTPPSTPEPGGEKQSGTPKGKGNSSGSPNPTTPGTPNKKGAEPQKNHHPNLSRST